MNARHNGLARVATGSSEQPSYLRREGVRDAWRMLNAWARSFATDAPVRAARRRPAAIGATASGLAIKRRRYESGLHVIVSGELDSVTAPQLKQQCERLDPEEAETVLLELADVTRIDASGLDVLSAAYAHLGERLVIIIGPACADAVDIANLRDELPIIEG